MRRGNKKKEERVEREYTSCILPHCSSYLGDNILQVGDIDDEQVLQGQSLQDLCHVERKEEGGRW